MGVKNKAHGVQQHNLTRGQGKTSVRQITVP